MTYQVHISLKSFDSPFIETCITKILQISNYSNPQKNVERVVSLPTLKKNFTVLRSPHVDKKSREQFQWKRYKKSISLHFQKIGHISLFLFLLKNVTFPGVQVEINLKHSTYPFFYSAF